jgi:hypothetical protein
MTETPAPTGNLDEPGLYEIRIKGHLDDRWATWFEGMTLTRDANGETQITGPVIDQAALHGVLKRVRDLGMTLLSVDRVQPDQEDAAQTAANDDRQ